MCEARSRFSLQGQEDLSQCHAGCLYNRCMYLGQGIVSSTVLLCRPLNPWEGYNMQAHHCALYCGRMQPSPPENRRVKGTEICTSRHPAWHT
jgi:hypothetical protein